jgi:hypothetical protein
MNRALMLAALAGSSLLSPGCRRGEPPAPGQKAANEAPPDKDLGPFVRVPGTKWLLADIDDSGRRRSRVSSYNLSSGSGTSPRSRNVVFLDPETGTFRRLLPTNDWLILDRQAFPEPSRKSEDPTMTTRFLYQIVKADTDRDDELSEADLITVAISDADGDHYAELLTDVGEVHTATMGGDSTLVIIHRTRGKLRLSRVDLGARQVVDTTDVPSFGADVR